MISSVKDPRIAAVRELATASARRTAGRCVLEGGLLIRQAVEAGARLEFVLLAEDEPDIAPGVACHQVAPNVLKQAVRSQKPVSALAVAELDTEPTEYGELAVVLERIADPGNLGTIVRTACGLGAADIVLTDEETDLSSRRVLEASRASVLRAAQHRYPDPLAAMDSLRARGFELAVTAPEGDTVPTLAPLCGGPLAVVLGNETEGVSKEVLDRADHVVRIPMAGEVESLNVGVAAGITLAQLRDRMVHADLAGRCTRARFTEPIRATLRERFAGSRDASAEEFEALVTAMAGSLPDDQLAERLRARGWLTGETVTPAGEMVLVSLWPEYRATVVSLSG